MPSIDVVEVQSARQLRQFIDFPNQLYKDEPNYVTPLLSERKEFFDRRKNPFYRVAKTKLFLALQDGKVCGRIATCINYPHNEFHEDKVGFFGFFDTPDDFEIAHALLKVAMITLKKEGMEIMRGPMNFSTNHEIGFLVEGFDMPPQLMMTYNYPYQPALAERFGFTKAMDLLGFKIVKSTGISDRQRAVVERIRKRANITLRTLNLREFDKEVTRIRSVYNRAWAYNWGFVPLEEDEFTYIASNMKRIVDPDLVLIAEHQGEPVAFCMALPDINQALIRLKGKLFPVGLLKLLWHTKVRNKINQIRLVTMGIVPEYQRRGIDSVMFVETFERAVAKGYVLGELSWILETNDLMCRSAEAMGAELYKRYRIMEMPLNARQE